MRGLFVPGHYQLPFNYDAQMKVMNGKAQQRERRKSKPAVPLSLLFIILICAS
jgi:hypothetical protein